jgi:hypothetical protein
VCGHLAILTGSITINYHLRRRPWQNLCMKQHYMCFAFAFSVLLAPRAHACSCIGRPVCGAFEIHDTLFVGKAVSMRIIETRIVGIPFPVRRRVYRFEVTEPLSGTSHVSELEIETGLGGGDCGYAFEIGRSYLVDASRHGETGNPVTGLCNATKPESEAKNSLREIRQILAHQRLPDVSGAVLENDSLYSGAAAKPLAGVTVRLTPASGNSYTAVTNSDGLYSIPDLPAEKYQVHFELPPNLVNYEDATGHAPNITIPYSGDAACHVDAKALPSGTITGQIIDVEGKPAGVSGIVSLRRPGENHDDSVSSSGNATGQFTIKFVRAGEYRVVYRIWGRSPVRETWLEPDAAHPRGIVTMTDGEQVTGITLVAK